MYHIIVNPASRSGKGLKIWQETLEPTLKRYDVEYQVYFSEKSGDVGELAENILQSFPDEILSFIILGGDGTVNEFLQGAEDLTRVRLGYIPSGSGGDLARSLHIPKDPAKALELILQTSDTHALDVGVVDFAEGKSLRFAVSCGIGYDANVCEEVARSGLKKVLNRMGLGKLIYLSIALKQIITSKSVDCTLTIDGKSPISMKRLLFIAIMVHRYEGGGFLFCPDADACDGILNLCTAFNLPKMVIPFILPTAFWGKHFRFKNIDPYTGTHITIEAPIPLWVHTDGEVRYQSCGLSITCMKQALHMYY